MSKIIFCLIFLQILNFVMLLPCKEGSNNCIRCDPLTNLCKKCSLNIYSPDENGGCSALGKCELGQNYCLECDDQGKRCQRCEAGLYPDQNGACSYIDNCELSHKGYCLKCNKDFILVGGENDMFKICKSLNSEDLLNCEKVNNALGLCDACKQGYFLNTGDLRCTKIENCYESRFGRCVTCNSGFYLDKRDSTCKSQADQFLNCKESVDGVKCDVCVDDYFFDDNGKCVDVNFCSQGRFYGCDKCFDGYYLTFDKNSCTKEKNCYSGDKLNGLCNTCYGNNYIDLDDRKCKSNQEDNDFKYCKKVENGKCLTCEYDFNLSEDGKCTMTKNCTEVDSGKCLQCSQDNYLTLDNRCVTTEHCIYSETYYECKECEDGFYYNKKDKICLRHKEGYENCKSTSYDGDYCFWCKTGFYNNQTNRLCYSNKEKNNFYKCTLSDTTGAHCIGCEDGYFIGYKDHKCSKIDGCEMSENEDKCVECDERHCLNAKTGQCFSNEKIKKEEEKLYYRCVKTNEEGTKCAVCLDDYELSENGFCVDKIHCTKEENGVCVKCKNNRSYSSCLNSDFGCVPTSYMVCIECNNVLDFDICTKCPPYYKINEKGECIDIDEDE